MYKNSLSISRAGCRRCKWRCGLSKAVSRGNYRNACYNRCNSTYGLCIGHYKGAGVMNKLVIEFFVAAAAIFVGTYIAIMAAMLTVGG